jgi:uncharacterized protein YheU (UPF0270 family)
MIIPHQQIAPETLNSLLEEHALRDGTDYGELEVALSVKVEQLKRQLVSGEIVLVYSELHESVNLIRKSDLNLT